MNAYDTIPEHGPVIVTHDGRRVGHPRMADSNEAFAFLLRWQGQSVDYALTHGGYAIVQVPADRWSDLEAREYRSTAQQVFRHDHPQYVAHTKEERELVQENCSACVLEGYRPKDDPEWSTDQPNYAGWGRVYVESGRPIPSKWRRAFEFQMSDEYDNQSYSAALRLSVATFGVRFD